MVTWSLNGPCLLRCSARGVASERGPPFVRAAFQLAGTRATIGVLHHGEKLRVLQMVDA